MSVVFCLSDAKYRSGATFKNHSLLLLHVSIKWKTPSAEFWVTSNRSHSGSITQCSTQPWSASKKMGISSGAMNMWTRIVMLPLLPIILSFGYRILLSRCYSHMKPEIGYRQHNLSFWVGNLPLYFFICPSALLLTNLKNWSKANIACSTTAFFCRY